jgi:acylphosphatase
VTRAVEVRVTGRVQGVSFRVYAAHEAVRLGLAGWVRNDPDGAVSAHLEGPGDAVEEMLAWCRRGSPAAQVVDVEVTDVDPTGATTFEVGS